MHDLCYILLLVNLRLSKDDIGKPKRHLISKSLISGGQVVRSRFCNKSRKIKSGIRLRKHRSPYRISYFHSS